jgi:hypothetical protein
MPIKRYDQTDPHDLGMSGVCGGDLHPVADGDWVLYDHHEQVVEKEVARLETMLAEVRTDLRIMRASHDRLAAERAEHADEVARLRECLRIAGLHAFMRVRPPDEVAAHLHMVLRSHSDAADKAEAELANARRSISHYEEEQRSLFADHREALRILSMAVHGRSDAQPDGSFADIARSMASRYTARKADNARLRLMLCYAKSVLVRLQITNADDVHELVDLAAVLLAGEPDSDDLATMRAELECSAFVEPEE